MTLVHISHTRMPTNNRKVKCDVCNKEMYQTNFRRHMKLHEDNNPRQERPTRKSTNFFMTFQQPCKYYVNKKLHLHMGNEWVKGLTVGNEWGSGYNPSGHAHALLTVEKPGYSLEDIKKILSEQYKIIPQDIQVAKNVKDCVRYISKEDYRCISQGHDKDHLSVLCRAYLYSLKYEKFVPTRYPYCHLHNTQKKEFREFVDQFYQEQEIDNMPELMKDLELREWQQEVVMALMMQNDRHILWLYDEEGGRGKTTLAKYLTKEYQALILHNGSTPDVAMAYNKEKYVIFDYTRTEERINYKAIEHLKNGIIFSSKYQSKMKFFPPPKILCLSNNLPDITGLSKDRWHILEFDPQGRLRRYHL